MPWPDAIDAELPPPHDGEPPALRAAIVDELADHLACAMDRERRRTDDEAAARRAVLDRFGDPPRIARRLWLDAMKETIMQQRTALVTNVVLAMACVAICILTFLALRQNAQMNAALLAGIESLGVANDASSMEWTEVGVHVTPAPGDAPYTIELLGRPFDGAAQQASTITETTDAAGRLRIGPVRPGPYRLDVLDDAGRRHTQRIILFPGRANDFEVPWRAFATGTDDVTIEVGAPEDVAARIVYTRLEFSVRAMADGAPDPSWTLPTLDVLVDGDGDVAVIDDVDATAIEEYMPAETGVVGRRARVDADRLVFQEELAVRPDLGYELQSIKVYNRIEGNDEALAVRTTTAETRGRRSRQTFIPPPPFESAAGNPWAIDLPAELVARLR